MDDWIEHLFEEIIWQALVDLYNDIASWGETQAEDALKGLKDKVGEKLASSPVVKVLAYDESVEPDQLTFFVRGPVKLFDGAFTVFMQVHVVISTEVDLTSGGTPIQVVEWKSIAGDVKIEKKNVFMARLALGYRDGVWAGRGAMKVLPAGFGLDLFLGGLSDRGMMIGLDIDLPAPIPLGGTGLALSGLGGDFAYNFVASLEKDGSAIASPTAKDYVTWAKRTDPLRWKPGAIEETAVGLGIRTDLVTLPDSGHTLKLEPIGLSVLTPGPVFILGGAGKVVDSNSAKVEGYFAVDIPSASLALGLSVKIRIPASGDALLVEATGSFDAFFSFDDPSLWYLNLGSDKKPIKAKVLSDLLRAELYFMINNDRFAFGAGVSIGGKWSWWVITLTARLGAAVAAKVGWNPVELEGMFAIWGELGLKVWKFKVSLKGTAKAIGHTPRPHQLRFELSYKLDLPWPIPDVKGKKEVLIGDETPAAPTLRSPLLAGTATSGGVTTGGSMELAGLHALTGRQWALDGDPCWPDVEIVVPFRARAIDTTGVVVGDTVQPTVEGGYEVRHELDEVKVTDISGDADGTPVPDLQAVWAAGPGGDTARLHVLGGDPFSWVVPHPGVSDTATETPAEVVEQHFGYGPADSFSAARRFGRIQVEPRGGPAWLTGVFQPALPTRVLVADRFQLAFRTVGGNKIPVDRITLVVVGDVEWKPGLDWSAGQPEAPIHLGQVSGSLHLWALPLGLTAAVTEVEVSSRGLLGVYAVRYRVAKSRSCNHKPKPVLKPGRYRIEVGGRSTATHPEGFPSSVPVDWQVSETFDVSYPETLRPYVLETTLGDSRLFFDEEVAWNPTQHGFGFPAYQDYRAAVRFLVPYLSEIFPTIRARLVYESGETVEQVLTPGPSSTGESFLLGQSQTWIAGHCGSVSPDEQVTLTDPYPGEGPARLHLFFDHPTEGEVQLDEWSAYVSRYRSCAEHLAWPESALRTVYTAAGPVVRSCSPPGAPGPTLTLDRSRSPGANRIDPVFLESVVGDRRPRALDAGRKLFEPVFPDLEGPYPEELGAAPVTWRLPGGMAAQVGALDEATPYRFTRFGALSGARFTPGAGDTLAGIADPPSSTRLDGVADGQNRLYALWVRTPEPVDWRRVTATLRIRHVEQAGDCPSGYAHRAPLDLAVTALPSPDATSAFLVGSFGGVAVRLPRGEYTLTLRFDPVAAGLVALEPGAAVGATPETVALTFVQPFGQDWPRPATDLAIPAGVLDTLLDLYQVDPDILAGLLDPDPDPDWLERVRVELRRPPRPLPRPGMSSGPALEVGHGPASGGPANAPPGSVAEWLEALRPEALERLGQFVAELQGRGEPIGEGEDVIGQNPPVVPEEGDS